MTTYSKMNKKSTNTSYQAKNGNSFDIEIDLFETPEEYDYWSVFYRVLHKDYGTVGFQCILPKEVFETFGDAHLVYLAQPLDRIKTIIDSSNGEKFERKLFLSPDGWLII